MSGYILAQFISISALSSGCNVEIKKQISFAKGLVCWAFDGQANAFNGQFHEGHAISEAGRGLQPRLKCLGASIISKPWT